MMITLHKKIFRLFFRGAKIQTYFFFSWLIVISCVAAASTKSNLPANAAAAQLSTWHPDSTKPYVLLFLDTKSVLGKHSVFGLVSYNDPLHGVKGTRFSNLRIDGNPLTQKDSLMGEYDLPKGDTLPSSVEVAYNEYGVNKQTRIRVLTFPFKMHDTIASGNIEAMFKKFQQLLTADESMDVKISPPVTQRNGAITYDAEVTVTQSGIQVKRGSIWEIPKGMREFAATVQSHSAHQSATLPALYCILMTGMTKEIFVK